MTKKRTSRRKKQAATEKDLKSNKVPDILKQQEKLEADIEKKRKEKKAAWVKKNRRDKIYFVIALFIFTAALVALFLYLFARQIFGDAVGDKLFTDPKTGIKYANGFTWLFAHYGGQVIGTLITIFVMLIITFVAKSTINVFMNRSKKARTAGAMLKSAIKYVTIIIAVCIILTIWGVDVASVIAGLGVLTLIIGLGCQSLVNDIVSGIFIVFDNYFEVGDMVIIDGFRGNVTDIGLRTVKLNDGCGNQKSITNSSINTCVNLSRYPNLIFVTMGVSYNEDLDHVEAIIAKELPKIKAEMPQIIDGPYYQGVDNFGDSEIDLQFYCTCDAPNRFQVRRDLQREIYQIMIRNNIAIPYPQIVIDQPDPMGKKATASEKKLAKEENDRRRALVQETEKKTFLETFITKTMDDDGDGA